MRECVLQRRHGNSTGLAISQSSSRKATKTPGRPRKATQTPSRQRKAAQTSSWPRKAKDQTETAPRQPAFSKCVLQQRQGISTGSASSVSSSRTAALTRSWKATQTRTVRDTKHTRLDHRRNPAKRHRTAKSRALIKSTNPPATKLSHSPDKAAGLHTSQSLPNLTRGSSARATPLAPRGAVHVCVTTETRHLDRLGQLGEFEQESSTDSEQDSNTDAFVL